MRKFRVCFAKRLSGKQQALDYDWDIQIPPNFRLELQTPRVERCGVCCFVQILAPCPIGGQNHRTSAASFAPSPELFGEISIFVSC